MSMDVDVTKSHAPFAAETLEMRRHGKTLFGAAAYADAVALVADGANGYLFTPGDPEDLKRALPQAFAERVSWPTYGAPTRAAILEKHSWEAQVQELIGRAQSLSYEERNSRASG